VVNDLKSEQLLPSNVSTCPQWLAAHPLGERELDLRRAISTIGPFTGLMAGLCALREGFCFLTGLG